MGAQRQIAIWFTTEECYQCHMPFQMTSDFRTQMLETGETFYCPAGHSQHYAESTVQKLEKQLAKQEKRTKWAEESRANAYRREEHALRSASAIKGHLTRAKRRTAAGACLHCKRTFKQLRKHMQSQHPDKCKDAGIKLDPPHKKGKRQNV